jgi:hypothetical protein
MLNLSSLSPQIFKYDDRIGPLILLIFFGMLLFGYGYVYLFIPETRGLTLKEVCLRGMYIPLSE